MTFLDQYRRDGYVVVDVFDGLKSSNDAVDRWKAMPHDQYRHNARLVAASSAITNLFHLCEKTARALGVRFPMFLTQPAVHVMGVDETWEGVKAHQDFPSIQTGLNTVVCWIPLTDVGLDNYPVEFVPGSHLNGLLPAKLGAHYSEVDATGMEFVPVPARVGQAIFFNVFTVHRTRTPGTGIRLAISHRFEDAADPWYVEHQYSAQSRVIDREIKFAPTVEQVRRVFD